MRAPQLLDWTAAVVARLEDESTEVRWAALSYVLSNLEATELKPHAAALKARLEDDDEDVCETAELVVVRMVGRSPLALG